MFSVILFLILLHKSLFLGIVALAASLCKFAEKLLLLFIKALGYLNVDRDIQISAAA